MIQKEWTFWNPKMVLCVELLKISKTVLKALDLVTIEWNYLYSHERDFFSENFLVLTVLSLFESHKTQSRKKLFKHHICEWLGSFICTQGMFYYCDFDGFFLNLYLFTIS